MTFLICALILLFGCTDFSSESGFIALSEMTFEDSYITYMDTAGDTLLFVTDNTETLTSTVYLWNLKSNKLFAEKSLTSSGDNIITDAKLEEKNIVLYNEAIGKQYKYDRKLNLILEEDYYYEDPFLERQQNTKNIDTTFNTFDSYATKTLDGINEAIVFYNNDDITYFQENNDNKIAVCSIDNRILYCIEKENELEFSINNYETMQVMNTASINTLKTENISKVPYISTFSDKYICVPITDDNGYLENIYYWNYNTDPINQPFEAKAMNNSEIETACDKLVHEIESRFSVDIVVNPVFDLNDFSETSYDFTNIKIPADEYLSLQLLVYTLSLYPEGIFEEICTDTFDNFKIYLTGEILNDEVDAYTSNLNGCVYIVLASYYLRFETIAHEIMHTIDYKLPDIDTEWLPLNPEDFSYEDYGTENEIDYEVWSTYFVREYGMKDQLEDRAVIMEGLFLAALAEEKPDFLKNNGIQEKAKLLCTEIRNAYETVGNADQVFWEKYVFDE